MLNAEKHRDQLLKFVEENHDSLFGIDKNSEPISCAVSRCNNCQFGFKKNNYIEGYSCSAAKMKWLLSEYKEPIKLTRTEYLLLCHVYKLSYKYIARDKDGDISLYLDEPDKDILTEFWHGKEYEFTLFNNLFPFIKWEDKEPTLIKEVLNNCEVVEDESK
ncbi:MAG: hypothetical protein MR841_08470 [Lactobacillus johnsonii]|nr:hypothetical protein [Lactobacillus johnsonii]